MTVHLHLDFETASELDLALVGLHTYAEHPSTKVIVASWATIDGVVRAWKWGDPLTDISMSMLLTFAYNDFKGVEIHAHNAEFEWVIWNKVFIRQFKSPQFMPLMPLMPLEQMNCSMARALNFGLPASLDDLGGVALDLPINQRKIAGRKVMLKMSRPRNADITKGPITWWHEDTNGQPLADLVEYCKRDVLCEMMCDKQVPALRRDERTLWMLNCRMNQHGVGINLPFVNNLAHRASENIARLDKELSELTHGAVTSSAQVGAMLAWLNHEYLFNNRAVTLPPLKTLAADTLENAKTLFPKHSCAWRVIGIRQEAAKSSTAKLKRYFHVCADKTREIGMGRGAVQYYGAQRSGRYAGRLFQPHNLPRGKMDPVDIASYRVAIAAYPDPIGSVAHLLTKYKLSGELEVISRCLRACIVPSKTNHMFVIGDFAQIEARVLPWLAGQQDILDVFTRGEDVYTYTANRIGSKDRQLGKVLVLGLGYGMGHKKFVTSAAAPPYNIVLDPLDAEKIVAGWRFNNDAIVKFWRDLEAAAIGLVALDYEAQEQVARVNLCTMKTSRGKDLYIFLPSGRPMVYRSIRNVLAINSQHWNTGTSKAKKAGDFILTYDGVNALTHQWGAIETYGGKLAENITQGVARDVLARALRLTELTNRLIPVLTVHDEIVAEFNIDKWSCREAEADLHHIMNGQPGWAPGLPVAAEVFTCSEYRK